jgi:hypothetical protein
VDCSINLGDLMFKKLSTLCLLLSFAAQAGLPPATTKGQSDASAQTTFNIQVPFSQKTKTGGTTALIETGNKNLLVNSSFENTSVATGWTFAVTGSNTGAADTTNFTDGVKSYAITDVGGAAQSFTLSQDVTPTQQIGGKAIEVSCWVKNTIASASPTLCARSGGSDLTSGCTTIPVTSGWQQVSAQIFSATAGSSVGIDITDNLGSAGTLNVDECYVGEARNIGTVAQAIDLGSITFNGANVTNPTVTGVSTFGYLDTVTGTLAYATSGSLLNPVAHKIGFIIPSLPAGTLYIYQSGTVGNVSSGGYCFTQFTDGTNVSNVTLGASSFNTNNAENGAGTGRISYTTSKTNLEIDMQVAQQATSQCQIPYGASFGPLTFIVQYVPASAQQVLNASTSPANWSGTSTLSGSTAATGGPTDPGSVAGTVATIASQNITCVAATSLVGVTCTVPTIGMYHFCYSGSDFNSGTNGTDYAIIADGSNNALTGLQTTVSSTANAWVGAGQCVNYAATATTFTLKVRGYVSAGTGGFSASSFSIVSLNTPIGAAIINNSITTNAAGAWRHEVVSFGGSASGGAATSACTSSPCTIAVQTGSWVSSVTRTAAGSYTVTFSAGMFSAPPQCVCISGVGGVVTPTYCGYGLPVPSTSSVGIYTSGIDNAAVVSCDGPR